MKKMAKYLITALLGLAFFPQTAFSHPIVPPHQLNYMGQVGWFEQYDEAVKLSRMSGKPIVVLFTGTTWCPACVKLERDVLSKEEFAKGVGERFIFYRAEFPSYTEESVKASPHYSLLQRYHVESFPTMVVINADGQLLKRIQYQPGGPSVYVNQLLHSQNSAGSPISHP